MNLCLWFNKEKVINLSRLHLLYILELQIFLLCDQLTYLNSQRTYVKFHLRNYYGYILHEHISLESPKMTICLNPIRYYGAFEKAYCYQFPSTMT